MSWTIFLFILALTESDNRNVGGDYVNGGPTAYGILQIHRGVITDVNDELRRRGSPVRYSHWDAWDPDKAREICKIYLERWGRNYTRITGKKPNTHVYAKIWRGGPYGWKKAYPEYIQRFQNKRKQYYAGVVQ